MNESFLVERTDIKSLLSNYVLSIPPFQRKFVWGAEKKRELIDSLNMSFPIGAITLYLHKEERCYLIVDGLQRINTIRAYLANPCQINPFKIYFQKIKDELAIFVAAHDFKMSLIKKAVRMWYESLETPAEISKFKYKDFSHLQHCIEENKLAKISGDLGLFQEFRTILLKPIDIEEENIGLITYMGDLNNLPDLFSKINQKNVSLTGYEILHSLWYKYTIPQEYPGFEKYIEAFKILANKSEGYVKLNDGYFDSFNIYMNISALEEIIEEEADDSTRKFFGSKSGFQVYKSETVFDIFSTICLKTTNRINDSVQSLFSSPGNVPYAFILALNNAIVEVSVFLNKFIERKSIDAYSKYFYIYFFYYIFINMYSFDMQNRQCIKKTGIVFDEERLHKDMKLATEKRWFKDEYRQLSFFTSKVKELSPQN